jgi:tRNA(Ile)-lysidine synthase
MTIQDKFYEKMDALAGGEKSLCAAVSGGPDSMALALLAHAWANARGIRIEAAIVDHRLRPEAAAEAEKVHGWLGAMGISHAILTYKGEVPKVNIEAAARDYRYGMLADFCRERGLGALSVAHNADEQRETFFLALTRGSSAYGLAGMAEQGAMNGVRVIRPLLGFPKAELKEFLTAAGQEWIEDPSNHDEKFKRVKIRKTAEVLESLGLAPERVLKTMENMRRMRDAIEFYTDRAEAEMVKDGRISPEFKNLPDEVAIRLLARMLAGKYPPRLESLMLLWRKISDGTLERGYKLAGRKIALAPDGCIEIKVP